MRKQFLIAAALATNACTTDNDLAMVPQPINTITGEQLELCIRIRELSDKKPDCDSFAWNSFVDYCKVDWPDETPHQTFACWPNSAEPTASEACVNEALPYLRCLASQTTCLSTPCVHLYPAGECSAPRTNHTVFPSDLENLEHICGTANVSLIDNGVQHNELSECNDGHTHATTCRPNEACALVCDCETDGKVTHQGTVIPENYNVSPSDYADIACGFAKRIVPYPSLCKTSCETSIAANCKTGPTDQSQCESDCTKTRNGACSEQYTELLICNAITPLTCNDDGAPWLKECEAQQRAFLDCIK